MLPIITDLEILDDFKLHIFLDDGFDFVFDFKPCLAYPCNKNLKNITLFKQAKFHRRMVYWSDMHDIHLDQMIPDRYLQQDVS